MAISKHISEEKHEIYLELFMIKWNSLDYVQGILMKYCLIMRSKVEHHDLQSKYKIFKIWLENVAFLRCNYLGQGLRGHKGLGKD